jgi:hypothetical protein
MSWDFGRISNFTTVHNTSSQAIPIRRYKGGVRRAIKSVTRFEAPNYGNGHQNALGGTDVGIIMEILRSPLRSGHIRNGQVYPRRAGMDSHS